jgi:hypothetical protein
MVSTTDIEKIEPIYPGDLDFKSIMENPILKPLAELNRTYVNFELIIHKALNEYEEEKKMVDDMVAKVPKYSETIFVGRIQNMIREMKTLIHAQDVQKEAMKRAIAEMIDISRDNYRLIMRSSLEPKVPREAVKMPIEIKKMPKVPPPKKEFPAAMKERGGPIIEKENKTEEKAEFIPIENKDEEE